MSTRGECGGGIYRFDKLIETYSIPQDQGDDVSIHTVLRFSGIMGALPFRVKPSNKSSTLLLVNLFRHVPNCRVISSPPLRRGSCESSSLQVLRWQRGRKRVTTKR